MTPDELAALETIRGLAGANRVALGPHARRRMNHRGAKPADVRHALTTATRCTDQRTDPTTAGDWKVTGVDCDGDELTCAVLVEGQVVVCTLF